MEGGELELNCHLAMSLSYNCFSKQNFDHPLNSQGYPSPALFDVGALETGVGRRFKKKDETLFESFLARRKPTPPKTSFDLSFHDFDAFRAGLQNARLRRVIGGRVRFVAGRTEENTSELKYLIRNTSAFFCLKKNTSHSHKQQEHTFD